MINHRKRKSGKRQKKGYTKMERKGLWRMERIKVAHRNKEIEKRYRLE
jgi:hypothetical protein